MFETKIDEQTAEQIRQRIARNETTRQALADEYHVDRSTITRILQSKGKRAGWYKHQRKHETTTALVYGAFIEEILAQMRPETFTVLYKACDHIADESTRLKILDWVHAKAKMVILEASEDLREHLLSEMERLFAKPSEEDESAPGEA